MSTFPVEVDGETVEVTKVASEDGTTIVLEAEGGEQYQENLDGEVVAVEGDPVPVNVTRAPSEDDISPEVGEMPRNPESHGAPNGVANGEARMTDEGGPEAPEATPAAEALASELGVELSSVEGTGADGRITKDDVEDAAAENV